MALKSRQTPGINLTGEYLVAGHTYISDQTTGANTIDLKYLSNEVTIIAEVDGLDVTFTDGGGSTRKITLPAGSHTFRIKCKKIVFGAGKAHSAVIACTGIPVDEYVPPNFTVLGT